MIVELRHVYKDYVQGKMVVPVLRDINFGIEEGEYVAIMGPSGSGKSTLMNIIGCLDQATSGELLIDGRDVSKCTDNEMADVRLHKIGFIFQNFQLLPRETALENVALPLSYAGVPVKERRERAAEALERVGLGDRVKFTPTQLSGGQKQRVAIARAMINKPKILLADEPTGALDQASGRAVMELFRSLNEEGISILMITHDANIARHADRIVEIWDGELRYPDGEEPTFSGAASSQEEKKTDGGTSEVFSGETTDIPDEMMSELEKELKEGVVDAMQEVRDE
ncbi:MAG: ABC transporter ATP-binding protein [Lachnospiraceae bacterium]|nr:ABC transporter ATP-binding protein [Lachnospiraceae bacterium]